MGTSANIQTPAPKRTPLYKRKRRRIYAAITVVVAVIAAVSIWLAVGTGSSGPLPSFTISLSQGSVATGDSIIVSDAALQKTIPAHIHWIPFTAGVTAVAEMKGGQATRLLTGPQASTYLAQAAGVQGVPTSEIESATKANPFIPLSQQLYWLGATPGDTTSPLVKAYQLTGQFLLGQGRVTSVPSAATLAAHVDPTFVKKALSGGC
jgi:ABC-type taurine transport system substrate-binding protein